MERWFTSDVRPIQIEIIKMNNLKDSIEKNFHRSRIALSLFRDSLSIWPFADWTKVWFTRKKDQILVSGLKFKIRNKNFISKLADIAMIFEVTFYKHYSLCKIMKNDTIIDIGSHLGSFSLLASQKANRGKIFAYEPSQSSFRLLQQNIFINGVTNIYQKNMGVSIRSGEGYIFQQKNNAENSLYKKSGKKEKIKITTLADIFASNKLKSVTF